MIGQDEADFAIVVDNVTKIFQVRHNAGRSLKSKFVGLFSKRYRERVEQFKVLDNINLRIPTGSCMGIVGHNGSGKSTLLQVMAGILQPTTGQVLFPVCAKIGTMIQLGVGFSPELTGAENIYLNASLYGFSRQEVSKLYDSILEFSGLGDFIDTPVKNYSSGMYARLGFSVTVHLDVNVLLIDEILGVGDILFQEKCMAKMNEFRSRGRTIVFVSHSPEAVQSFCDSACLLHHGRLIGAGTPARVMDVYQDLIHGRCNEIEAAAAL